MFSCFLIFFLDRLSIYSCVYVVSAIMFRNCLSSYTNLLLIHCYSYLTSAIFSAIHLFVWQPYMLFNILTYLLSLNIWIISGVEYLRSLSTDISTSNPNNRHTNARSVILASSRPPTCTRPSARNLHENQNCTSVAQNCTDSFQRLKEDHTHNSIIYSNPHEEETSDCCDEAFSVRDVSSDNESLADEEHAPVMLPKIVFDRNESNSSDCKQLDTHQCVSDTSVPASPAHSLTTSRRLDESSTNFEVESNHVRVKRPSKGEQLLAEVLYDTYKLRIRQTSPYTFSKPIFKTASSNLPNSSRRLHRPQSAVACIPKSTHSPPSRRLEPSKLPATRASSGRSQHQTFHPKSQHHSSDDDCFLYSSERSPLAQTINEWPPNVVLSVDMPPSMEPIRKLPIERKRSVCHVVTSFCFISDVHYQY